MRATVKASLVLIATILMAPAIGAQEPQEADTTKPSADTLTPPPAAEPDSAAIERDTLTGAQQKLADFEKRWAEYQETEQVPFHRVSFVDTLLTYFASERFNRRAAVDRSFYHDPGDYFRGDPSFFILEHQVTPMRKTVQPFGLPGNRLNLFAGRLGIEPFEHVTEPDGLVDMNDVPTALDDDVFVIPGPFGQLLGGSHALATMVTRPKRPESESPESAILADKGSFGYSYVRGRLSKRFSTGREYDASIGYRDADGPLPGRSDDAYHYYADMYFPTGKPVSLRFIGWLYDRDGAMFVRPESSGYAYERSRVDRTARLSLDHHNADFTERSEVGYRYLLQGSNIDSYGTSRYWGRFKYTGHGGYASREWVARDALLQARVDLDYLRYEDYVKNPTTTLLPGSELLPVTSYPLGENPSEGASRLTVAARVTMARPLAAWRYAVTLGWRAADALAVLPQAAVVMMRDTPAWFVTVSMGYVEREPTLHELYLRSREVAFSADTINYKEQGNDQLVAEKQMVGSMTAELGSVKRAIGLSVTSGRLRDAIFWKDLASTEEPLTGAENAQRGYTLFTPVNGTIDFLNASLYARWEFREFAHFSGGVSWHGIDQEFEDMAYQPNLQAFTGLELSVDWRSKKMRLWAYGELVYTSGYDGYWQRGLGGDVIANAKLSFGLKDFRWHFVFQNVLSQPYQSREYLTFPGRYVYYGFSWTFVD